jgi:hypothetical protein
MPRKHREPPGRVSLHDDGTVFVVILGIAKGKPAPRLHFGISYSCSITLL